MSSTIAILLLTLTLALYAFSAAGVTAPYEVLRAYGLPIGLLPRDSEDTIASFEVDAAGRFELRLRRPCTAHFETDVHYEELISGVISYGVISSLTGIEAQELFLWLPVTEIRVDVPNSGLIYFDVGVIHKQFSLYMFETPPECSSIEGRADI